MKILKEYKDGSIYVSTVINLGDVEKLYETIIYHPSLKGIHYPLWDDIVVGECSTEKEALENHNYWEEIIKSGCLPYSIINVSTCNFAKALDRLKGRKWRVYRNPILT